MSVSAKRKAVFLDRDGVLNRAVVRDGVPHPPHDVGEMEILPGVVEAAGALAAAGFVLIGITNQPDVARGTQARDAVERINDHLAAALLLKGIYVCYHDNVDGCSCRKPKPGLIFRAAADYNVDVSASFMVGDRWSDIAAGQAAGCKTILICCAYSQCERCRPDFQVQSLPEAAAVILGRQARGAGEG